MAKGAAAPIEAPTVTAAKKPPETPQSNAEAEAETRLQSRSNPGVRRRNALLSAALLAAAGVGVVAAVALGLGDDATTHAAPRRPPPRRRPRPRPRRPNPANLKVVDELTIGRRPNVVRSRRRQRLRRLLPPGPHADRLREVGQAEVLRAQGRRRRQRRRVRLRLAVAGGRAREPGRPARREDRQAEGQADQVRVLARLGGRVEERRVGRRSSPATSSPTCCSSSTPRRARRSRRVSYPYGIMSLTASPTALWVGARRRARVQRVDLKTGQVLKTIRVGNNRPEDVVYDRGSLWIATPRGQHRLQDVDRHRRRRSRSASASSRASSRSARASSTSPTSARATSTRSTPRPRASSATRSASPVNPFSLAIDDRGALWVGSLPENKLSKVATDRGG